MADALFAFLDGIQWLAWRCGVRFQWPGWLVNWAWYRQATPYTRPARKQLEADGASR